MAVRPATPAGRPSIRVAGADVLSNLVRLTADEDAQDLVEYALLGAFVAITGVLAWQGIITMLGQKYTEYNTNVPLYWEPPAPAGGS